MGIFENLLLLSLAVLALTVIGTHRNGRDISSFLVGVSAGLVAIQVFRVHVFTIMVLVWLLQRGGVFNSKGFNRALLLAIPVGMLALTAVMGDLVNSDTLVFQLMGLAATAALVMTYSTQEDRQKMIGGLLAMVTISSIVGLLQVLKIVPIETWHASISSVGRPIGLYPEPDWLGMFAGVGLVIAWRLPMGKGLRIAAVSANAAALILAFARAAWIAVAVAIAVTAILGFIVKRRQAKGDQKRGRFGAVTLMVLAAGAVALFTPQLVDDLFVRLSGTLQVQAGDISGEARLRQFNSLMRLAESAPFYGHGLSASGRVGVWGQITTGVAADNNVASNWMLAMWVDGKYFAVPLILLLCLAAVRYCLTIPGQALVVVLVSSFFSNATFFPVTWALLAICLAGRFKKAEVLEPPKIQDEPSPRRGPLTPQQVRALLR